MRLRQLHRDELLDIAKRGSATALVVILFWGITAPAIFFDNLVDASTPCYRYGVAMTTIVVAGCFWSSYRNLLTPDLSENERKLGFVLFWFCGSYVCEVTWVAWFSAWNVYLFAKERLESARYPSILEDPLDLAYRYRSPSSYFVESLYSMVTANDCFHLCGLFLFGLLGWGKYNQEPVTGLEYREALFWFAVLGIFQCWSFLQSISLSFHMDGVDEKWSWPEPGNPIDQCILWSVRLFPVLGYFTCATFSYQLLFNKGDGKLRQQPGETK